MKKKNIKIKKGNGDISITIENNLNANNKQINHQPIKRKRRKKKIEDTEEINKEILQQAPPELPSYIKPGPVGAFKIWQNAIESYNRNVPINQVQPEQLALPAPEQLLALPPPPVQLALPAPPVQLALPPPPVQLALPAPPVQLALPAPPAQLALPEPPAQLALPAPPAQLALPVPEQQQGISFDNFTKFFTMMSNNQRNIQAPPQWGRNLIDDDDSDNANTRYNIRTAPSTPLRTPLRTPAQSYAEIEFDEGVDKLIKEEIETKGNITGEEMLTIRKDARDTQIRKTAKRMGTIHGKTKIPPNGQYMDLKEYQDSYQLALEYAQLLPQPIGRTRAQTKKGLSDNPIDNQIALLNNQIASLNLDKKGLFTKEELTQINEETKKVDNEIASLKLDKWNKEKELAKAGLKTTVMTNEDAEDAETEINRLLFGT